MFACVRTRTFSCNAYKKASYLDIDDRVMDWSGSLLNDGWTSWPVWCAVTNSDERLRFIVHYYETASFPKLNYLIVRTEFSHQIPEWSCGDQVIEAACLESRRSRVRTPHPFKFHRKKMFISRLLANIQYCGEPLLPRGSVLDLRPPGLAISNPVSGGQRHLIFTESIWKMHALSVVFSGEGTDRL